MSGIVYLEAPTSQEPAAGITVEAVGVASTVTDAKGSWSLALTANANVLLRATANGDIGVETVYQAPPGGATGQDFLTLSTSDVLSGEASVLSTSIDTTTKGLVLVELEGVTTTNYAVSVSASNGGSFGINAQGSPVSSAATQSISNAVVIFYNVTPGTTTVTVAPPQGKTCSPDYTVDSYPVDTGIGTQVAFLCN